MISKTDYLLYRECKKNAWLKIHKPDIYYAGELSDFEKSIIETGNEVESIARQLFPTGILIEGRDIVAQERTAKLVKDTNQTLFQPVFVRDGFMAAIDVLQYDPESKPGAPSYSVYEIKASNQVKEDLHLYDLAFQVNLLRKCGLKIGKIGVIHLNSKYVREGELDIIKLFVIDDVSEKVNGLLEKVDMEMQDALKYLLTEKEPSGHCSCVYKGRSSHCTTFTYSNPEVPKYGVHDIARIGLSKAKLIELIDGNIFDLNDVPEEIELSEIQKNQIAAHITGRTKIEKDKIMNELSSLQFPLYFIDYETFPAAIPRFDGFSPYQQIPFQYSLHIVESTSDLTDLAHAADANDTNGRPYDPIHREFLYTGSDDPSKSFAESMVKDIGKIGSIIVWNKSFECNRNIELAKRSSDPKFKSFITSFNERVYDLEDIFKKQYLVHRDFKGKTSIKNILPVVAPELTYKNLDIRNGGSASDTWNRLVTGQIVGAEKEKSVKDLLKYCERDSYAMYAIWKHLMEL